MSHTTPTPGPWFFDADDWEEIFSDDGALICRVMGADDFPCLEEGTHGDVQDECLANARLIAAAPAMLEALKDAVDDFANNVKERDPIPSWLGKAVAAISSAQGEASTSPTSLHQ